MSKLPLIGVPSLRVSHPGGLFLDLDSEFNHTDNDGKKTRKAMPVSLPLAAGITCCLRHGMVTFSDAEYDGSH